MQYVLVLKSVLGGALAASLSAQSDSLGWVAWSAAVVTGLIVLVVILFAARRRLVCSDRTSLPEFSLDQLRTLRARGDLSDAEYVALRTKMLDRHRSC